MSNFTTPKKHNKKRNTTLIYELLVRKISESLISNDTTTSESAMAILKKYFKPSAELFKEYRLGESLIKINVSNKEVASQILWEARAACRRHDVQSIDKIKTLLVNEINQTFGQLFWDTPVPNYKLHATVSTLLSDWKDLSGVRIDRVAQYEDKLVDWMLRKEVENDIDSSSFGNLGEQRYLFKLMSNKIEERYNEKLTQEQRSIMRSYVCGIDDALVEKCNSILDETKKLMIERSKKTDSQYEAKTLNEAVSSLPSEILKETMTDDVISQVMICIKMQEEIKSIGEEK
jgi:hypothetical protein